VVSVLVAAVVFLLWQKWAGANQSMTGSGNSTNTNINTNTATGGSATTAATVSAVNGHD
jgi:hypothetical protein